MWCSSDSKLASTSTLSFPPCYSDAWLALLQLPIPPDILRKVLLALQRCVMPSMLRPVMLCDFLTHAVERGGLVGMLALNGLFVLVTQHGLEYPQVRHQEQNLT